MPLGTAIIEGIIMTSTTSPARKKASSKQAATKPFGVYMAKSHMDDANKVFLYGRSLGLRVKNRDRFIAEIQKGLKVSTFGHFSKQVDLQERELAQFAIISTRTLARRKEEGRLSADESDRLVRLSMLFDEAVDLFEGNRSLASKWFRSPKKALGGLSPIEYANTEPGTQEVRDLIGRIEHGVFS